MSDASESSFSRPPCSRDDALAVLRRLRDAGHTAYFAGGCVRDTVMGLTPKDYDVATDAPPQTVRRLFPRTQAVGAAFGVILVREGMSVVEVATFRSDLSYRDGRHPTAVRFTTAAEDAQRRDFTINGLFLDPLDNDRIIDHVGGQQDIAARVLRAIGNPDRRFEEDHLRLMRAVRFAARFGLSIEAETDAAILRHAPRLARISPERIAEELRLMITPPTRVDAWRAMQRLGLVEVLMRFLPPALAKPSAAISGGRSIFERVAPGRPIGFALALAALVLQHRADTAVDSLARWLRRDEIRHAVRACRTALRISNDEADGMAGALDVGRLLESDRPTVASVRRFLAGPAAPEARMLLGAIRECDPQLAGRATQLEEQFARVERIEPVAPPPLLTGDDLMAAGFQPGPAFKKVLDAVYDAQLEDRVRSIEQALDMARGLFPRGAVDGSRS